MYCCSDSSRERRGARSFQYTGLSRCYPRAELSLRTKARTERSRQREPEERLSRDRSGVQDQRIELDVQSRGTDNGDGAARRGAAFEGTRTVTGCEDGRVQILGSQIRPDQRILGTKSLFQKSFKRCRRSHDGRQSTTQFPLSVHSHHIASHRSYPEEGRTEGCTALAPTSAAAAAPVAAAFSKNALSPGARGRHRKPRDSLRPITIHRLLQLSFLPRFPPCSPTSLPISGSCTSLRLFGSSGRTIVATAG